MEFAAWQGPPVDVLGHVVPLQRFVARSERAVVALTEVIAYPEGCTLTLHVAVRRERMDEPDWNRLLDSQVRGYPSDSPGDELKFGVRFPDGSRATTVEHAFGGWARPTDRPEPPMLVEIGSDASGSDRDYRGDQRIWLWPLPSGPFELVLRWQRVGIGTAVTTLDGEAIARAAEQAQPYWP